MNLNLNSILKICANIILIILEIIYLITIYPELDEIQENIKSYEDFFIELKDIFSKIIKDNSPGNKLVNNTEFLKVDFNDRDGKYLSLTKKRFEILKTYYQKNKNEINLKSLSKLKSKDCIFNFNDIEVKHDKANTKIFSKIIKQNSDKIILLKDKMNKLATKFYVQELENLSKNYDSYLKSVSNFIAEVDVIKSCAKCSIIHNYKRPVLNIEKDSDKSFLIAKNIRHPIIIYTHRYRIYSK